MEHDLLADLDKFNEELDKFTEFITEIENSK